MKLSTRPEKNVRFHKQSLLGVAILSLTLFVGSATAQNFPHIKTFGFDYIRFADNQEFLENLKWLANRHDWIVGPTAKWPAQAVDYMDATTYYTVKEENPNTLIMKYLPYHSIAPTTMEWVESWCRENNKDPEDLYYHYYVDTTINLANGSTLTVPGFGGGSAATREEARVRVRWNGGWVGINPSSQVFRDAYQALAIYMVTVEGTTDTFADGLFLDTFEGIVDDQHWSSHLENTIEMRNIGTTEEVYAQARADLVSAKLELEEFLRNETGNPDFRVHPNSADADYIYNHYSNLYNETYRDDFPDLSIEFLVTTTTNRFRIERLQQLYNDMENGRLFFIRSQTNYAPPTPIAFAFTQFVLATHYLINHKNVHFMYHYGSAANYGGYPYGNPKPTHWHQNMEVNIGVPTSRTGNDYWGAPNTDRFYELASSSSYNLLAREYSNALVLAKFSRGGFVNIGTNPTTHQLDGEYYPLLEDNTTGSVVTSVTLGESEGIILLKQAVISSLPRPQITESSYEIRE